LWLNLVERFFGLLTEKALKRGLHTSIPELRRAILDYVEVHNERSKPLVWSKSADAILESVRRFGQRTMDVSRRRAASASGGWRFTVEDIRKKPRLQGLVVRY